MTKHEEFEKYLQSSGSPFIILKRQQLTEKNLLYVLCFLNSNYGAGMLWFDIAI